MLKLLSGSDNSSVKMLAFILTLALLITAIVPLNAVAGDDTTETSKVLRVVFGDDSDGKSVTLSAINNGSDIKIEGDLPDDPEPTDDQSEFLGWSEKNSDKYYKKNELNTFLSSYYKEHTPSDESGYNTLNLIANFSESKAEDDQDKMYTLSFMIEGDEVNSEKLLNGVMNADLEYYVPKNLPNGATGIEGWYTDENLETKFDFTKDITKDTTVYSAYRYEYLVSFIYKDPNDSENDAVKETHRYQKDAIIQSPDIKIDPSGEYHFDYWYYLDENNEEVIIDFDNSTLRATKDLNIYAKMSNQYRIIFISEGTQVPAKYYTKGASLGILPTPSRTGYTFTGWKTEDDRFVNSSTKVNSDMVLYAQWTAAKVNYTLVYWLENPNTGDTLSGSALNDVNNYMYWNEETGSAYAGSDINISTTNSHYVNVNNNKHGTVTTVTDGTNTARVGDYTGIWKANTGSKIAGAGNTVINVYFTRTVFTYTFSMKTSNNNDAGTYKFKSGFGDSGATTYSDSNRYSFTAKFEDDIYQKWPCNATADFTNSGDYQFRGWVAIYDAAALVTPRMTLTGELIPKKNATAHIWIPTIQNDLIDKTATYYLECLPGDEPNGDENSVYYNGKWYVSPDNLFKQKFRSTSNSPLNPKGIEGFSNDKKYYKWEGNSLIVDTDTNKAKQNNIIFLYNRNNKSLNFDTESENVTITSTQKADGLGFDKNSNSYGSIPYQTVLDQYVDSDSITAAKTVDGIKYKFEGWYYDAEYYKPVKKGDTMPNQNLTLFAKWTSTQYNVNFYDSIYSTTTIGAVNKGAGEFVLESESPYEVGEEIADKGVFIGWLYKNSDNGKFYEYSYDMPVRDDINLYAKYKVSNFTLAYDVSDAEDGTTAPTVDETFDLNTEVRLDYGTNLKGKNDKVFIGWQRELTDGTLVGSIYVGGSLYKMTADTTMKAIFGDADKYYKVTYHENFTGQSNDVTAYYPKDDTITLAGALWDHKGHELLGWSNTTDGGVDYELGAGNFKVDGNKDLFAVWSDIKYTVEFKANNGGHFEYDNQVNLSKVTFDKIPNNTEWKDAVTVPSIIAANDYYFAGWTVSKNNADPVSIESLPLDSYKITSDEIYYANFSKKMSITISALDGQKTYDGTPLTKNSYECEELPAGYTIKSVEVTGSATNVGDDGKNVVKSWVIEKDGKNVNDHFKVNTVNGKLTVDPKTVTVTSISKTWSYDSIEHKANEIESTVGFVGQDGGFESGLIWTGVIKDVGTTPNSFSIDQKTVKLTTGSATNYNFVPVSGELKVTNNATPITITALSVDKVYDGKPLTKGDFKVEGDLPSNLTISAVIEGSITDVGTTANAVNSYEIMDLAGNAVDKDKFTEVNTVNGKLTVDPKTVTVTSVSEKWFYDSTEHKANEIESTVGFVGQDGGFESGLIWTGVIKDVGTTPNSFSIDQKTVKLTTGSATNYKFVTVSGELEITNNVTPITITALSVDKVYDGKPLTQGDFKVEGDLPSNLTISAVIEGSITDVGTTANAVRSYEIMDLAGNAVDKDKFTEVNTVNGKLTIDPKTVTATSISKTWSYDSIEHKANEIESTVGFVGQDGGFESGLIWTGVIKDVGTTPNSFSIDQKTVKLTTGSATNYKFVTVSGELEITNNVTPITITALSVDKVYDGKPLTQGDFKVEGDLPSNLTISAVIEGSITDVGTTTNAVNSYEIMDLGGNTVDKDKFTEVNTVNGKLEVTKASLMIKSDSDSWTYDAGEHDCKSVTVSGLVNGETLNESSLTWQCKIKYVGTTDNAFTYEADKLINSGKASNYNIKTEFGKLEIKPITEQIIQVIASSSSMEYTGNPLTNPNYMYDETALPEGHTLEAATTGSQIEVGSSPNKIVEGSVIIRDVDGVDVTEAFSNIELIAGLLTVSKVLGDDEEPDGDDDEEVKGDNADPGDDQQVLGQEAKTSDELQMWLLIGLLILAMLTVLAVAIRRKKTE